MKSLISRWIMRAKTGGQVLRIPLLGVTALSTMVTALELAGLSRFTLPIVAISSVGAIAFLYLYDELGILNRQSRDTVDRADNFVGPTMTIQWLVAGRAISEAVAASDAGATHEEIQRRVDRAVLEATQELRDGIDTEAAFGDHADQLEDVARTNGRREEGSA